MERHEIRKDSVKDFVFGGNSTFTIRSKKTGTHLTFCVRKPDQDKPYFVAVLSGPNNTEDYHFLGCIFENRNGAVYRHGRKSRIGPQSKSNKAFEWFFNALSQGKDVTKHCEIYHEGRCARCGRKLTTPESVQNGFGPECIKHV